MNVCLNHGIARRFTSANQTKSKTQPTTVNMCIVLSSAANASLATAVFNAVLSNFLGVFVAPATIFLCVGAAAVNVPYLDVVRKLVYKVRQEVGMEIKEWGVGSYDARCLIPTKHTPVYVRRCSSPCCWE